MASLAVGKLIGMYRQVGIDVSADFGNITRLTLEEDASGLLRWLPPVVGSDVFYAQLSERIDNYYPAVKPEFEIAAAALLPGQPVLEIGCGEGHFAGLLPPGDWFGVDINSDAIRRAQHKGLSCVVWDFLKDDPAVLPRQQFPFICSFQMLEHLPDPGRFFQFAAQHLSPGGRLILAVPSLDSLLGKNPMSMLNVPPHHQTWWSDRALREFPSGYGFVCEKLIHAPLDPFHHRAFVTVLLRDLLARRLSRFPRWFSQPLSSLCSKPISALTRILMEEGSIDSVFGCRGQSVVAVYHRAEDA
ncbi:bifunctional 2-polyprenyl-6-hydroxyphenol methylase/3-demethylubiquinol 3-O-methyltransferase UbiG [Synechococcus sp. CCY 9618]|uniref:class I SAM-dependent methyltransferase n=1 Tax=Synechococcus sp. CCY 9618 TaxID=2815602 RepID=UPI001C21ECBA|nr:class I SAM-dependent methyltransferase [Synechococcus sp. CCY 9618]